MPKPLFVFPCFLALSLASAVACSTTTILAPELAPKGDSGIETPGPEDDAGIGDPDATSPEDDSSVPGNDSGKPPVDAGPFVEAPHSGFPQIPANQGIVLAPLKVVTIVASNDALGAELLAFSDALVTSNWLKETGKDYGITSGTSVKITSTQAITANISQSGMNTFIGNAIASHPEAADDGNTMYMLYLPDNVVDIDSSRGVNTNCQFHGGYHTIGTNNRVWGFGARCPTQGTGLSKLQSLTVIGSHEIIEAATDPEPGRGYTLGFLNGPNDNVWSATQGETGDMCVSTQVAEGQYTYQRVWSNTAAAKGGDPCLPAVATPYYNVSTNKQWYSVAPSGSVTIPLTGWSTGRITVDWVIDAQVLTSNSTNGFTATVTSPTTVMAGGTTYGTINNGNPATLTVKAPAASGAYAVIGLDSLPRTSGTGQDPYHFNLVGVFTP